jgi:hypothetical protein
MKTALVTLAAMAMVACGGTEYVHGGLSAKAAAVSRVTGGVVVCDAPSVRDEAPPGGPAVEVTCGWECLRVDGQAARWFYVHYARVSAADPWTGPDISVEYSRTEQCASIAD